MFVSSQRQQLFIEQSSLFPSSKTEPPTLSSDALFLILFHFFRSDQKLQDIIFKLVPGLHESEYLTFNAFFNEAFCFLLTFEKSMLKNFIYL